jgi:hypothetical protein
MVAFTLGSALVWAGALVVAIALAWLIVWLMLRGYVGPDDFIP